MSDLSKSFTVPRLLAWLFIIVIAPTVVFAQSTIDPKNVEFDPSADHSATSGTGSALVTRYDLEFYLAGAAQPFQTLSMGKPNVLPSGKIQVSLSTLGAMPSPGISYEASVAAVGPGGAGHSGHSNTFSFSASSACNYAASPTNQTMATSGGAGNVAVTSGAGCTWSASSSAPWLTISSGNSGSGSGSVGFTASANTSASARTGTLTVAGVPVTIQQSGTTGCVVTLTPTAQSFAAGGGAASVSVASTGSCAWSATSNAAWLTINSGGSGAGNGVVNFTVAANSAAAQRTGALTIAGQAVSIVQSGVGSCTASVNPMSNTVAAAAGSTNFSVTTGPSCAWTATSSTAWLTLASGGSGTGNGTVVVNVQANASTLSRTGVLTVAGVLVNVKQNGTSTGCTPGVTPTTQLFTSAGGNAAVSVTAAENCSWTAKSNTAWLTLASGASGSGTATVNYTAAANTTSGSRTGSLTVAGQTVSVTQSASSCTFGVSPSSGTIAAGGGSTSFAVTSTSACSWTATSNTGWLTVASGASGTAKGTVVVTAPANTSTLSRTGSVTIGGTIVNVKQDPTTCTFTVSPMSQTIAAAGDTSSVGVTTTSNCNWTASTTATWLTVISGSSGSGNATVAYKAAANSSSSSRTATLMVAGKAVSVTQSPAQLTPPSNVRVAPLGH